MLRSVRWMACTLGLLLVAGCRSPDDPGEPADPGPPDHDVLTLEEARSSLYLMLDSPSRTAEGLMIVGAGTPEQVVSALNPNPFPVSCTAVLTYSDGSPMYGGPFYFAAPTDSYCLVPYAVDASNSSQASISLPAYGCCGLNIDDTVGGAGRSNNDPDAPYVPLRGGIRLESAGGWAYAKAEIGEN